MGTDHGGSSTHRCANRDKCPIRQGIPADQIELGPLLSRLDQAARWIGVAQQQLTALRTAADHAPDGGIHEGMLAQQLVETVTAHSTKAEAAELVLRCALGAPNTPGDNLRLLAATGDSDAEAELDERATHPNIPDIRDLISDLYADMLDLVETIAARVPDLDTLEGEAAELVAAHGTPADAAAGDTNVIVGLPIGDADQLLLNAFYAAGDDAAIDWNSGHLVLLIPPALASHATTRGGTILGPDRISAHDPIPLVLRIADILSEHVPLDDAYDAAVLRGATSPYAIRHAPEEGPVTHPS